MAVEHHLLQHLRCEQRHHTRAAITVPYSLESLMGKTRPKSTSGAGYRPYQQGCNRRRAELNGKCERKACCTYSEDKI